VVYESDATNLVNNDTNASSDIFLYDRETKKTTRVSVRSNGAQGSDDSNDAGISANGRWTAFASDATNLVNNDTNADQDIFLRGPLR
jgi:Tol biopolymer transport system component